MNGRTDGWTDQWKDGRTERRTDERRSAQSSDSLVHVATKNDKTGRILVTSFLLNRSWRRISLAEITGKSRPKSNFGSEKLRVKGPRSKRVGGGQQRKILTFVSDSELFTRYGYLSLAECGHTHTHTNVHNYKQKHKYNGHTQHTHAKHLNVSKVGIPRPRK